MLNHRNNSKGILINRSWSSLQAFLEPFRVACILKINDLRIQKNRKTRSSTYTAPTSGYAAATLPFQSRRIPFLCGRTSVPVTIGGGKALRAGRQDRLRLLKFDIFTYII